MKQEKCTEKYCRKKPTLNYLGKRICQQHWEAHCDGQPLTF